MYFKMVSIKLQQYWYCGYHKSDKFQAKWSKVCLHYVQCMHTNIWVHPMQFKSI